MPKHTCRGDGTTPLPWWGPPSTPGGNAGPGYTFSKNSKRHIWGAYQKEGKRVIRNLLYPGFHSLLKNFSFFFPKPLSLSESRDFTKFHFLPNSPFSRNSLFYQIPPFAKFHFSQNPLLCQFSLFCEIPFFTKFPFFCQNPPFHEIPIFSKFRFFTKFHFYQIPFFTKFRFFTKFYF
ncbi:unnamed protein product [Trypanosoma congolense IL3000]|uniref:WGS project CAEQ00000000 data, annotated contig 2445 n=1 Tax=Trypanosoma congolense (strain IL3000) TaxID=1068625 RepID=F9WE80_TRYCI|nr:unnamed protein product [Trypanosoma congolense IL3000]